MAIKFRDQWLELFYVEDKKHRKIPASLENALFTKLYILDAARIEADLRTPPGNRFEYLRGCLSGWCSIRVNRQYRLIFRWHESTALDTYLDAHDYN